MLAQGRVQGARCPPQPSIAPQLVPAPGHVPCSIWGGLQGTPQAFSKPIAEGKRPPKRAVRRAGTGLGFQPSPPRSHLLKRGQEGTNGRGSYYRRPTKPTKPTCPFPAPLPPPFPGGGGTQIRGSPPARHDRVTRWTPASRRSSSVGPLSPRSQLSFDALSPRGSLLSRGRRRGPPRPSDPRHPPAFGSIKLAFRDPRAGVGKLPGKEQGRFLLNGETKPPC